MKAAAEKISQEGGTTSHGPMVSANFNDVTVAFAYSESDYTAFSSHHIPSLITAPKVIVEVGENLSIKGAYIKGEKVDIKVAKDLLIESLKDVNTMASSSSSISLGVSFGCHGIAPAVSFAVGEGSENSELVNFISGIGGGDVSVVAEKIHLKGSELYGTEKLKVIGEVSKEDIEEINESSSAHFGISFDPTKATGGGNPLTSVNFGISEKHDNGVVHSGLGQQASHESTSKGGYTVSGEWNNVLQGNAEKAVDWLNSPPANDHKPVVIPEAPDEPDEAPTKENKDESKKQTEKKEHKTKAKPKAEEPIASKAMATEYSEIDRAVDNLEVSGLDKEELKHDLHKFVDHLRSVSPERQKEIIDDLDNQIKQKDESFFSKISEFIFPKAHAMGPATPAVTLILPCLANPLCAGLVALTASAIYLKTLTEINKETIIISTPEHRNEGSILDTPEHKKEYTDRGFTPWNGAGFKDQGFTPVPKELLKNNPGFDIHVGDDMSILYYDDSGDTIYEYWPKYVEHKGNKVYQRDDLIDPNYIRPDGKGTNLESMKQGYAPIGIDGKPINLHHIIQTEAGGIAEVMQSFHQKHSKVIHINPSSTESGIDRNSFKNWRGDYWKERAKDFIKE